MVAPFYERANRRRSRIEDGDLVFFDQLPETAFVRKVRRAFVHEDGGACREWAINHVRMAGHPADIRGAPEDVVIAMIEDPLKRLLHEQVVTGGRVLDAL